MGRVSAGVVSAVLGVMGTVTLVAAPVAAAAKHGTTPTLITKIPHAAPTSHVTRVARLAELGHGTFWECSSSTTPLLVGINRAVLHPGQALNMNFIVKNDGTKPCNYVAPYASASGGAAAAALDIGPCGSLGFKILGAKHKDVWPGVTPFNCPALGFAELQPGASVSGLGTWAQTLPNSTKRIPAGSYTLVIGNSFSFPITIAAH
jgi:hypothetical protein